MDCNFEINNERYRIATLLDKVADYIEFNNPSIMYGETGERSAVRVRTYREAARLVRKLIDDG